MQNGLSWHLLLEKRCKKSEEYYFIQEKWVKVPPPV